MNKIILHIPVILLVLLFAACGEQSTDLRYLKSHSLAVHTLSYKNSANFDREKSSVVIAKEIIKDMLPITNDQTLLVCVDKNIVPSQMDDLNGNGLWDELVFQIDMKASEEKEIKIFKVSSLDAAKYSFPSKVHAQMGLKNGKAPFIIKDSIYSESGDLYKASMHHGPATESEIIAYRMYFDDRSSIDIYGKYHYRLELDTTKWYSNDEFMKNEYGGDVLFVKNTIGVGSLRLWNGKVTQTLKTQRGRYAVIRARGPVRTVIDMIARDVKSDAGNFTIRSRMIQYANTRTMIYQAFVNDAIPQFCTGVRKMVSSQLKQSQEEGWMGIWGTDYPRLDHKKYPPVTVGLGVVIPLKYFEDFKQDSINHIVTLKKGKRFLQYYVTAAFKEEKQGIDTPDDFFKYIKQLSMQVNDPIKQVIN